MIIHPTSGAVVHGLGRVSIDGVPVPALAGVDGWTWGFLGDEIAGPATHAGQWVTLALHLPTGALRLLEGGAYPNNTNVFGASVAGTWAASGTVPFETRGPLWPAPIPGVLHTVTRDGWTVRAPDLTGFGIAYEAAGVATATIPGAQYLTAQDGRLLYRLNGRLLVRTLATGADLEVPDAHPYPPAAIGVVGPAVYGLVWLEASALTVIYPLTTPTIGWVVGNGTYYGPALIARGEDLRVVSSRGPGEAPEEFQDQTIDLAAVPVVLAELPPVVVIPPPIIPPPVIIPPPIIPPPIIPPPVVIPPPVILPPVEAFPRTAARVEFT